MNIVLLEPEACQDDYWRIDAPRQYQHICQQLALNAGDRLKVGIRGIGRFQTELVKIEADTIWLKPLEQEKVPSKLPLSLVVALPRPKVLRRLIMDSTSLGVDEIILIHSYRVDKSYWQSPLLQKREDYVTLGLEQAGDVHSPKIKLFKRFKPFVEDHLSLMAKQQPVWVAHPYAKEPMPSGYNQPCVLIVGPEGGFIPYEIELLTQNGAQAFHAGARILRTETAISYLVGRLFV